MGCAQQYRCVVRRLRTADKVSSPSAHVLLGFMSEGDVVVAFDSACGGGGAGSTEACGVGCAGGGAERITRHVLSHLRTPGRKRNGEPHPGASRRDGDA